MSPALVAAVGILLAVVVVVAAAAVLATSTGQRRTREVARSERSLEQARQEVAATSRRARAVLDGLPQALLLFDADDQLLPANAGGRRYLQARHGDALVEAAARRLAAEARAAGSAEGTGGGATTRRVDLAGPPRLTFELATHRLGDGSGDVLVVVDDVTERRRLEEVRRDFVANISHELRTPLGALSLLAETLADEQDPEVAARLARRLQAEAIRLGRTVDDLVWLSGIEGGATQVEPVRLVDAVGEAVERRSGLAEARQIEVKVDLAPSDLVLQADRRQLVSAVANLLDNALNYSDPGSVVLIRSQPVGERVELSVVDHGVGIPARDLERIFERFYRVDRARSRQTGGTGLGLAVVRHVVTNHGGDVVVHSREGEGSTFVLRLPLGDVGTGRPAPSEEHR